MKGKTLLLGIALAGLAAAAARADGLPVLGVDVGSEGVARGPTRYVTLPVRGDTLVARIATRDGRVLGHRLVRGSFTVPAVAYDGSAGGLSADGRTLVLIRPRTVFPRPRTPLAILDTKDLRVTRLVTLRGDFSFDAVSSGGRWAYLVHYTSPNDPSRYEVRALDTTTGRLDRREIVDPHEAGDKMRGSPITRTSSRDGRWAYTLYDGAGGEPFVHALDTAGRTARCIDLPMLTGRVDLWRLRLTLNADGTTLAVGRKAVTPAVIDLRTFEASVPTAEQATSAAVWAVPVLGLVLVAAFVASRRTK